LRDVWTIRESLWGGQDERGREDEDFDRQAAERYMRENIEGLSEGGVEVEQFPSGASTWVWT